MKVLVGVHLFINTDILHILLQFRDFFPFQHIADCPFQPGRRSSAEDLFFTKLEVITNWVRRDRSLETVGLINNPCASFAKSTKTRSSVMKQ